MTNSSFRRWYWRPCGRRDYTFTTRYCSLCELPSPTLIAIHSEVSWDSSEDKLHSSTVNWSISVPMWARAYNRLVLGGGDQSELIQVAMTLTFASGLADRGKVEDQAVRS